MDQQTHLPKTERTIPGRRTEEIYRDSCVYVERERYYAAVKGTQLTLTKTEFYLLSCLVSNMNRVVTVEDLWAFAWKSNKPFKSQERSRFHKSRAS